MKSKGKLDGLCEETEKQLFFVGFTTSSRTLPDSSSSKYHQVWARSSLLAIMARNTVLILIFIVCALCISQNGVYAFGAGNIPSLVIL